MDNKDLDDEIRRCANCGDELKDGEGLADICDGCFMTVRLEPLDLSGGTGRQV